MNPIDPSRLSDIFAVVVTYNTTLSQLTYNLGPLRGVCNLIISDNSTIPQISIIIQDFCLDSGFEYLTHEGNIGIAAAQNKAIKYILPRYNPKYILLLDDDTKILPSQLVDLRTHLLVLPDYIYLSCRLISPLGRNLSNAPLSLSPFSFCRDLNSSATLIPSSFFQTVGFFDVELFIDCVDFAWSWRARRYGLLNLIDNSVVVQHTLGQDCSSFLRLPSPHRHAYQYRNILYLISKGRAPFSWSLQQYLKLIIKPLLLFVFANRRSERFSYILQGVHAFVNRRLGPM